ncbi:MAG: methylated-DNA--[protein]-cysteine S-methyltransferase [Rhizobium sp.]|nr:methylated-DNA--[protein]-cysteine S-methyltransferase [Rhizobium sp.]
MTVQRYAIFDCALGFCGIAWNGAGISRFHLPANTVAALEGRFGKWLGDARQAEPTPAIEHAIALARRYFSGEQVVFADLELDLSIQTAAFQNIYAVTRSLGWGQTTTYGTIARELGLGPEGARDIGQAMARNPVPLIIPCHRVLAAGGKLGGFSAPGGTESKRRMLEMEGVHLAPAPPAQQSFGF